MTLRQPYRKRVREKAATARIVYVDDEDDDAEEDMDAAATARGNLAELLDEAAEDDAAAAVKGLSTRDVARTMALRYAPPSVT